MTGVTTLDVGFEFWVELAPILYRAEQVGLTRWRSKYGTLLYNLTSAKDPFEGIPAYDIERDFPATIPDPEFIGSDGLVKNIGPFSISQISIIDASKKPPLRSSVNPGKSQLVRATVFFIDDREL